MSRKALLYGAAAAALLGLAPAPALADDVVFSGAGEHPFTVPPGVSRLQVELTGAPGGSSMTATGGTGAFVQALVAVMPGQTLYAEVGGAGRDGAMKDSDVTVRAGGYNGGGTGASGGGGASDLRAFPATLAGSVTTRLAVAGGGGGGGFDPGHIGGGGGGAGLRGYDANLGGAGGQAGTDIAGGAAGIGYGASSTGNAGGLGQGGSAANVAFRGGGGGGGYFGGGAGGGVGTGCSPCWATGGGGGGSSLVPAGGSSRRADPSAGAQVHLSWETPRADADRDRVAFPDTLPGAVSPAQSVTLTNLAASSRLEISDAAVDSDDFLVTSSTCRSVAPGASCVVKVRFAPAGDGAKTGTLTLPGNGPQLTVALSGRAPAAAVLPAGGLAGPAGAQGPAGPAGTAVTAARTARVSCHRGRCTVRFAGAAPRVTGKRAKVTAKLTRGGVTYAGWQGTAKRGPLRLTLKATRSLAPGAYTLTVTINGARLTQTATV